MIFSRKAPQPTAPAARRLLFARPRLRTDPDDSRGVPDTLDPQVTAATAAFQVSKSIYDTLVEVDRAGNLVPALASSYEVSADGLTYTFELAAATFHDGTALDAADVVATLDRIRAAATGSPKAAEFAAIASVEAQDASTVVVSLTEPQPAFLSTLASGWGAILPSEKLAAGHDFGNQPVGTGPFSFVSWSRDNAITLAANPDYYQGAPLVDQVVIRFVTDSAVQLQGLLTGEFDVIDTVAAADQQLVEANPSLELVRAFRPRARGWHQQPPSVPLGRACASAEPRRRHEHRDGRGLQRWYPGRYLHGSRQPLVPGKRGAVPLRSGSRASAGEAGVPQGSHPRPGTAAAVRAAHPGGPDRAGLPATSESTRRSASWSGACGSPIPTAVLQLRHHRGWSHRQARSPPAASPGSATRGLNYHGPR